MLSMVHITQNSMEHKSVPYYDSAAYRLSQNSYHVIFAHT